MVSKVAVIALVAIVACPILLGYAMNLNEVTVTEYKSSNDAVNVTPLLQNEVEYTSVQGDIYELNTNFLTYRVYTNPNYGSAAILPVYESFSKNVTSYPMREKLYTPGTHPSEGGAMNVYEYYYFQSVESGGGYIIVTFRDLSNNVWNTLTQVKTFYYVDQTKTFYYSTNNTFSSLTIPAGYKFSITDSGGYTGTSYITWKTVNADVNLTYVDLSAGYVFDGLSNAAIALSEKTKSALMTINLDSITDPSYTCDITLNPTVGPDMPMRFVKTTTDVVKWTLYYGYSLTLSKELYYDPSRNDNTYQLNMGIGAVPYSDTQAKVTAKIDLNYVGGWPSTIGYANTYWTTSIEYVSIGYYNHLLKGIEAIYFTNATNNITPVVRMDGSTIDGYEVPVISNKTYTPSDFKTNPATKISDISMYGTSIEFGGNTYNVDTDGNITMGTHKVPVNNMVLESVPISGGYENRINGTPISTTAQPSDIIFRGKWSASVSTASMESSTVTKTEWQAGSFGWDGIDHNFLIVGLLTSFGAFIALGIYMRRTKASLWPLLIVCGGAAVLFFIML